MSQTSPVDRPVRTNRINRTRLVAVRPVPKSLLAAASALILQLGLLTGMPSASAAEPVRLPAGSGSEAVLASVLPVLPSAEPGGLLAVTEDTLPDLLAEVTNVASPADSQPGTLQSDGAIPASRFAVSSVTAQAGEEISFEITYRTQCAAADGWAACTWISSGQEEEFTVPSYLKGDTAKFTLIGGTGGATSSQGPVGGKPGWVEVTVPVEVADTFKIVSGGNGWTGLGIGGWPGGGHSGGVLLRQQYPTSSYFAASGGGGGMTILAKEEPGTSGAPVVAIAAGGGGAGGYVSTRPEGMDSAGGNTREAGQPGSQVGGTTPAQGGGAATPDGAGLGGAAGTSCDALDVQPAAGLAGGVGVGGNGGLFTHLPDPYQGIGAGGGAGAGLYGGGGGGAGGACGSTFASGGGGGGGVSAVAPEGPLRIGAAKSGQVTSWPAAGVVYVVFEVDDSIAPETSLDSAPDAVARGLRTTFAFSGSDDSARPLTYECSQDSGFFGACTSPFTVDWPSYGEHRFRVRTVDGVGNRDATPAEWAGTVEQDLTPPETTIESGPGQLVAVDDATFSFTASDDGAAEVTFECSLDSGAFEGCASPKAYDGLVDGLHAFRVRAVDSSGNREATPAEWEWEIDRTGTFVTCATVEGTTTCEYPHTSEVSYLTFRVPDGITQISVRADGAAGAGSPSGQAGGQGGRVEASIPVTPGEVLRVMTGGTPPLGTGFRPNVWSPGGANGGGEAGYDRDSLNPWTGFGGGGGGATDIRRGPLYRLEDRLVVAGGGGGAAPNFTGGAGGGLVGGAGDGPGGSFGGEGGSQTAGGAGGVGRYCGVPGYAEKAGAFGVGGRGVCYQGTGGGGGGYYGGGGGGYSLTDEQGAAGGGGSSYAMPDARGVSLSVGVNSGPGSLSITFGRPAVALSAPDSPASGTSVVFTAVFSAPVSGLSADDIALGGSALPTTAAIGTASADGTTFPIEVSGMTDSGTIEVSVKEGAVTDGGGLTNLASSSASVEYVAQAATSLALGGKQYVIAGNDLVLSALLTSTDPACQAGQDVAFRVLDADGVEVASADATTSTSGTASVSMDTSGWTEGVHTVEATYAGAASCKPSEALDGTVTVAEPGGAASGGGWYSLQGVGRVNFGFTVRQVKGSKPAEYKGQILVASNGSWKLKGSVTSYGLLDQGARGRVDGTGDLFRWNAALGDSGDWELAQSGVVYSAQFTPTTSSGKGKKASVDPGNFGVSISFEEAGLPTSEPTALKGGVVKIA